MSKISLTPSKLVSAGSIVVLIFFLIFGIGFAVLVGNDLSENDAPLMVMLIYFFIFMWIGVVTVMLILHVKNYKSTKGLSIIDINAEPDKRDKEVHNSPLKSLRDLESLKKEGLISEKEYEQKRTQILEDRW